MCKNWGDGVLEKVHYDEAIERIVVDEEHHIDWIEAQRHTIAEVGYQQYLAQQIYASRRRT